MRKIVGIMAALVLTASVAQAQIEKGDKSVSIQGSITSSGDNVSGNLYYGLSTYVSDHLGLRFGSMMFLMGDADNTTTTMLAGGIEYVLAPRGSKTVPYIFGNYSFTSFSSDAIDSNSSSDFNGGAGIRKFLSREAALKVEGTYTPGKNGADGSLAIQFGIDYFFGRKR
jgi:hypothetical protein